MKLIFKKGKIYAPDSVECLPKECNKYFDSEEFENWDNSEFEFGTVRCIKSFRITITIKELSD